MRGQGNIGTAHLAGGVNNLVNNGKISADVSGGTLSLSPPGGSGSVVNKGTLQAAAGGTLAISSNVNNTAGQINALNGSVVTQSGVSFTGGTLATSGSGVIQAVSSGSNVLDLSLIHI